MAEKTTDKSWSQMYSEGRGKYRVINVLAKRARQINEGFRPVVSAEGLDPMNAAVAELKAEKLIISEIQPKEDGEQEEEEE
jgi:DNA-directed RNA polymerase subunit K/omega